MLIWSTVRGLHEETSHDAFCVQEPQVLLATKDIEFGSRFAF